MKKIIALSSVTLWLLLVLSIKADTPADNDAEFQQHSQHDLSPKIEAVINKAVELELFSGCVLIAKGDEVLFAKAYGEANKDFHIQNTMDTKFNIASGTKPFTSVAVMLLVQRGRLGLHDPVKKYLPEFPFADKITVYHCLTHTSGLGHYTKEYLEKMHRVRGFDAFLKDFIYREKPMFEPGARFSYSNSGVVVLGAIIEKVSGMTYADFLQKNIFEPLNMKDTCSKMPEEIIENRASGYIRKFSGSYLETSLTVCPPTSATGLRTTAPDLLKFIHGVHQNRLLNQELTKVMFTPFLSDDLGPYALLWDVIPDGIKHKTGNTVIGHRGGQDGFTSWYTLHRPTRLYHRHSLQPGHGGADHPALFAVGSDTVRQGIHPAENPRRPLPLFPSEKGTSRPGSGSAARTA